MFSKKATKIDKIFTVDLTVTTYCQIYGEDFVNFCGLLRKRELYVGGNICKTNKICCMIIWQVRVLRKIEDTQKNLVKTKVHEKCSFTNYFIPRYDGGLLLDLGSGSSQFFYAA